MLNILNAEYQNVILVQFHGWLYILFDSGNSNKVSIPPHYDWVRIQSGPTSLPI